MTTKPTILVVDDTPANLQLMSGLLQEDYKVKPDFISTGNIGCMTQISSGTQIPIVHTIEILNWYTGGEKPKAINLL